MNFIKAVYKKILLSILIIFFVYSIAYILLISTTTSTYLNSQEYLEKYNEACTKNFDLLDDTTKIKIEKYPAAYYVLTSQSGTALTLINYLINSILIGCVTGISVYLLDKELKFLKALIYLGIGVVLLMLLSVITVLLLTHTFAINFSLLPLYFIIYVALVSYKFSRKRALGKKNN